MLRAGVPVDIIHDSWLDRTALMFAAQYNRTDVIRLLLQNGADVNRRNLSGNTAVHWAAGWNKPEAIALLVKHGASINIKNNVGDKPIDDARENKSEAAVLILEQL